MDGEIKVGRRRRGVTRVSSKNQVTHPVAVLAEAGVAVGDELRVQADGVGRLVLVLEVDPLEALIGSGVRQEADLDLQALRGEWQVLVGAHPAGAGHATQRRQGLEAAFRIRPLDADIADEAARLRSRHRSLRMPDALVLITAEIEDAEALTADATWPTLSPRAVLL